MLWMFAAVAIGASLKFRIFASELVHRFYQIISPFLLLWSLVGFLNWVGYYFFDKYLWVAEITIEQNLCEMGYTMLCPRRIPVPSLTQVPAAPALNLNPGRSGPLYMVTPASSLTPFDHKFRLERNSYPVRDGISASNPIVANIFGGECIKVTKQIGGWSQIVLPHLNGFVHVYTESANLTEIAPTNRC
jgi:energy-coupling factor transporter transmembrane protein EcfT